jgi:hypothetical protein
MKSKKKITKTSIEQANGIRISYHEKVCARAHENYCLKY